MIKVKEIAGPSCLTSAADDEPIFVLRANDELAPGLVYDWACSYVASKGKDITEAQVAKYREAMDLVFAMREWKASHVQV
jgi:hypothetical protein